MKRRIALILTILLIIGLVGISFYGGPVTYIFLLLVVLVPLTCIVYILLVIYSLKIYQRSDGRTMVCSTPSDFYITLVNESLFSFSSIKIKFYSSFSTVSGLSEDVEYELPPHSSITRATRLVCRYRGEYKVGIKELTIRDFLGLFTMTFPIKEPLEVIVAPAMIELESLRLDTEFTGAGKDSFTNPSDADIIVREYVPGDDVRLIHHKATAVMQKLMVRERTGVEKTGIAIVMESARYSDAPEDYLPLENRIIESTLALALYYVKRSISVDVIYRSAGYMRETVRSHADYERLYSAMRSYSFGGSDSTLRLLDEFGTSTAAQGYCMLIFILADESPNVIDLIGKMNVTGVPSVIYATDKEPGTDTGVTAGSSPGIICIGTIKATEDVL